MRRTRYVVLPVRSWQYMGLMVVSLACLTLGLVSRDREGQAGSLAGPDLQHCAPHEVDACPNDNPFTRLLSYDDIAPHSEPSPDQPKEYRNDISKESRIASMAPIGGSRAEDFRVSGDLRARSLQRSRSIDHRERRSTLPRASDRQSVSLNSRRTSQGRMETNAELRDRSQYNRDKRAREMWRNAEIGSSMRENDAIVYRHVRGKDLERFSSRSRNIDLKESLKYARSVVERDVIRSTERHLGENPVGDAKSLTRVRDISRNNVRSDSRNVRDVSRNVRDNDVERFSFRNRIHYSKDSSRYARILNERRVGTSSGDLIRSTSRHLEQNSIELPKSLTRVRDISRNNVRSDSRNVRDVRDNDVERFSLRNRIHDSKDLSRYARILNERRVGTSSGSLIRSTSRHLEQNSIELPKSLTRVRDISRNNVRIDSRNVHDVSREARDKDMHRFSLRSHISVLNELARNTRASNSRNVNERRILLKSRNADEKRRSRERLGIPEEHPRREATAFTRDQEQMIISADQHDNRISRATRTPRSYNAREVKPMDIRISKYRNSDDSRLSQIARAQETSKRSSRHSIDHSNERNSGAGSAGSSDSSRGERQETRIAHASLNARDVRSTDIRFLKERSSDVSRLCHIDRIQETVSRDSRYSVDRPSERNTGAGSDDHLISRLGERQKIRNSRLSRYSRSLDSETRNSRQTNDDLDERHSRARFSEESRNARITERQNNRISRLSRNARSLDSKTRNSQRINDHLHERDANTRLSEKPQDADIQERQRNRISRLSRYSRSLDSETRNSRQTNDDLDERHSRARFSEEPRNARITERQNNRISRLSRNARSLDYEARNSQRINDHLHERDANTRLSENPHDADIQERQRNRISRLSRYSRSLDSETRNSRQTNNDLDERHSRARFSQEPRNARITERQNNRISRLSRNARSLDSEARNSQRINDHLHERDANTRLPEKPHDADIQERQRNRISRLSRYSRSLDSETRNSRQTNDDLDERYSRARFSEESRNARITERQNNRISRLSRNARSLDSETRNSQRINDHLHKRDANTRLSEKPQDADIEGRQRNRISRLSRYSRSLDSETRNSQQTNDDLDERHSRARFAEEPRNARITERQNNRISRLTRSARTLDSEARNSQRINDHLHERDANTRLSEKPQDADIQERQRNRISRLSRYSRSLDSETRNSRQTNNDLDERHSRARFSQEPRNARITERQNNRISRLSRNARSLDTEAKNSQRINDHLHERDANTRLSEKPQDADIQERQRNRISRLSRYSRSLNSETRNSQQTNDDLDERHSRARFSEEPRNSRITERQNNRISRLTRSARTLDSEARNSLGENNHLYERDANTRLLEKPRDVVSEERQNNRISRLSRYSQLLDSETMRVRQTKDRLDKRHSRGRFSEEPRKARVTSVRQNNRISHVSRNFRSLDSETGNPQSSFTRTQDSKPSQVSGDSMRTLNSVNKNQNSFSQRRATDKRLSERRDNRLSNSGSRITNDVDNRYNVGLHESRLTEQRSRVRSTETMLGRRVVGYPSEDKDGRYSDQMENRLFRERSLRLANGHSKITRERNWLDSLQRNDMTPQDGERMHSASDERNSMDDSRHSSRRFLVTNDRLFDVRRSRDSRDRVAFNNRREKSTQRYSSRSNNLRTTRQTPEMTMHLHEDEVSRKSERQDRLARRSTRRESSFNDREPLGQRKQDFSSNHINKMRVDDQTQFRAKKIDRLSEMTRVRDSRLDYARSGVVFNDRRERSDERSFGRNNNLRSSKQLHRLAIHTRENEDSRLSRKNEIQDRLAPRSTRRESSFNERQLMVQRGQDSSSNHINRIREYDHIQFRMQKNDRLPEASRAKESTLNGHQISPPNQIRRTQEDHHELRTKRNTRDYKENLSIRSKRRFSPSRRPSYDGRNTINRSIEKPSIFHTGERLTSRTTTRKNTVEQVIKDNLSPDHLQSIGNIITTERAMLEFKGQNRVLSYSKERTAQNTGREQRGRDQILTGRQRKRTAQRERHLQHRIRNTETENRVQDYQRNLQLSMSHDSVRFQRSVQKDQTIMARDAETASAYQYGAAGDKKLERDVNRESRFVTAKSLKDQLLPASIFEGLRQALVMTLCAIYGASIYSGKGASFGGLTHGVFRSIVQ